MKRNIYFFLMLCCVVVLNGCSAGDNRILETTNETEVVIHDQELKEETLGYLFHNVEGAVLDQYGERFIYYSGEELEINYHVEAGGIEYGCGFMIFIDGIPQMYRSQYDSAYSFMHVFYQEDIQENLLFRLYPSVGKAGDKLEVSVVSVYNPKYVPDFINGEKTYGIYHDMVENVFWIEYLCDVNEYKIEKEFLSVVDVLESSVEIVEDNNRDKDTEDYRSYINLYMDDKEMMNERYYDVSSKDEMDILIELSGTPGTKYKTMLYLDHQPLEGVYETVIMEGCLANIKVVLDVSKLTGFHTFYAVSVPSNARADLNLIRELQKSYSIALVGREDKMEPRTVRIVFEDDKIGVNRNLFLINKANLGIVSNDIWIYDIRTGEAQLVKKDVWEEYLPGEKMDLIKMWQTNSKLYVCVRTKSDRELYLFSFDSNMNYISHFNLNKKYGEEWNAFWIRNMHISEDEKRAFYQSEEGLYMIDLSSEKELKLLDFYENGFADLAGYAYIPQKDIIMFIALCKENAKEGIADRRLGIVNVRNREIQYLGDNSVAYGDLLRGEENVIIVPRTQHTDDMFLWAYNTFDENLKKLDLKNEYKDGTVYISGEGEYVVIVLPKSHEGITIEVLNIKHGNTVFVDKLDFERYGDLLVHQVIMDEYMETLFVGVYHNDKKVYQIIEIPLTMNPND